MGKNMQRRLWNQLPWPTFSDMVDYYSNGPQFFSHGSVSSPWMVTAHIDSELGHMTCFGQKNNSNCDRSGDLKKYSNVRDFPLLLLLKSLPPPPYEEAWANLMDDEKHMIQSPISSQPTQPVNLRSITMYLGGS